MGLLDHAAPMGPHQFTQPVVQESKNENPIKSGSAMGARPG